MHDHRKYVQSLYKRSLKLIQDWKHNVPECRRWQLALREQFEELKGEPKDSEKTWLFLRGIEHLLARFHHPEPYIYPYDPKGVAHGRECRLPPDFIENGDGRGKMKTLV